MTYAAPSLKKNRNLYCRPPQCIWTTTVGLHWKCKSIPEVLSLQVLQRVWALALSMSCALSGLHSNQAHLAMERWVAMATMPLCYSVKLLATWAAHIRGFAPVYETPQCFLFDLVKCSLLCFVCYQHCQCKEIFWTLFYYVRFYINAYYMSNSCKIMISICSASYSCGLNKSNWEYYTTKKIFWRVSE